jgi:hypothetical protein
LDPESRGDENVELTGLNLLQVPGGELTPFRQLLLSQASAQTFAAHVLAENPESRPLFALERHPILNPRQTEVVNDSLHREMHARTH